MNANLMIAKFLGKFLTSQVERTRIGNSPGKMNPVPAELLKARILGCRIPDHIEEYSGQFWLGPRIFWEVEKIIKIKSLQMHSPNVS